MAERHNATVGLLLTVQLLLQGVGGHQYAAVFCGTGEAATLACANVAEGFPQCSSTTWIYSRNREAAIEELTHGKVKPESTLRAERLSLLSNCSLHITGVTTEDAGLYACRQYEGKGGRQIRADALVELAVLTVSSTCPRPNDVVTLHCLIHTNFSSCEAVVSNRDVHLGWADKTGAELENTTKHWISRESPCSIRLTVTFKDPKPSHTHRTWTCHLTERGKVQASVPYTVPVGQTGTPLIPSTSLFPITSLSSSSPLPPVTRGNETVFTTWCSYNIDIPIKVTVVILLVLPIIIVAAHICLIIKRK